MNPSCPSAGRWSSSCTAAANEGATWTALLRHGVPPLVLARQDFPFITLSPQCPEDGEWGDRLAGVLDLLRFVSTTYAVDSQRIYLTGLSMGGRGAWQLAVEHPDLFAAVVPICGRVPDMPDFFERLPVLRDKPIWVFHGAQDEVVPIGNSDRIVAVLRDMGRTQDIRCIRTWATTRGRRRMRRGNCGRG